MRKSEIALAALLILGWCGTVHAQWRVGPVYPENPQQGGSASTTYNPFRLNWTTGRFDYVPVPYRLDSAAASDPYHFNEYSGRWDYVPSLGPAVVPSESQPQPIADTVNLSPILALPLTKPSEPAPPLTIAPMTIQHTETYYRYPRPEPTAPPTTAPAPALVERPSLAPTTRPAAAVTASFSERD
ncbi:MAG: hypothetical protein QOF78_2339 [Phycisphaerales bacterium]|nr:hypothetical protein [Phycisphaerales bacterium]